MEGQFKVFYWVTGFSLRLELQGFPCEFDGLTNLIGLCLFGWFLATAISRARQGAQWTPTTN